MNYKLQVSDLVPLTYCVIFLQDLREPPNSFKIFFILPLSKNVASWIKAHMVGFIQTLKFLYLLSIRNSYNITDYLIDYIDALVSNNRINLQIYRQKAKETKK